MDITLKNLGPIQEANFTVGDLTVICGRNNTGKTYITYATYGFLDYWNHSNDKCISTTLLSKIFRHNPIELAVDELENSASIYLKKIAENYSNNINKLLNINLTNSLPAKISIIANPVVHQGKIAISSVQYSSYGNQLFVEIKNGIQVNTVEISLQSVYSPLTEDDHQGAYSALNEAVKNWLFENVIPKTFIASAERTGAALFQREIDFTRSRLIDIIKETDLNPQQLLGHFTADYPLPVKRNIDFIRNLPNIIKKRSDFLQRHPDILKVFSEIVGGEYEVNSVGGVNYSPVNQPTLKLSLAESSSTVRSLVEIGFYLRHLANEGDLLMVDEPELNLHPENQRKIARLFAMLVNHGIRVFITTHSDYIIKEFNTLLLLNKSDERLQTLAQREGYQSSELLKPEQLNVYMTAVDERVTDKVSYTLIPAKITHDSGIELTSFNDTIEDMNRLQDEIVWG